MAVSAVTEPREAWWIVMRRDATAVLRDAAPVVRDGALVIRDGAPVVRDGAPAAQGAAPVIQDVAPAVQDVAANPCIVAVRADLVTRGDSDDAAVPKGLFVTSCHERG
ncbi:hypothetical protein GCM10009560_39680 [Nonomuraea longicatena]|uniref:Uncharacterized protein n=1 Tax=Nonomuraea longicatena TaxID=83682 RepID=A0ABP4A9G0_9ACTN